MTVNEKSLLEFNAMDILSNKTYIAIIIMVFIIIGLLIYISKKLNLKYQNCYVLKKQPNTSIFPVSKTPNFDINTPLNEYFIKTAYNCCCTGNFKNDYVDICALKNCAFYGVRALDFQIYSLDDKPIVSASSVTSNQYKEIYNHITFFDAITSVRRFFIDDSTNANSKDPLFLIFRLHTTNAPIYNMMAQALNEVYGYGSPMSNMIYILPQNKSLDTVLISELIQKVVIIVDTTYGDKIAFENSKLSNYSSLVTGSSSNNIYREGSLLGVVAVNRTSGKTTDISNNLTLLYPELQSNKNNYDFITSGIFNYVSFIGMNFQYTDQFLKEYNNIFKLCAFLKKEKTISTLCYNNFYSSTNICKKINKK